MQNPSQILDRSEGGLPDPSWRKLYLAGGISALLYVFSALVIPTLMVLIPGYDFKQNGPELLAFIGENKVWWIVLQSLVLETSILVIITSVALFVALSGVDKSIAAVGTVILLTTQILFMAYYPVLLGLVYLSNQYGGAGAEQQKVLATAAEALIAQNNAFNPVYESLFGAGIFVISLAMRKGIFHKGVAYLGMAVFFSAIVALSLWPVIGIGYFWWWLVFAIWFVAVGWRLIQLGRV